MKSGYPPRRRRGPRKGSVRAFFFDFDGVVVDTETPWFESILRFCQKQKLSVDRQEVLSCAGDGDIMMMERLCAWTSMDEETILAALRLDYYEEAEHLTMRPGVREYLDYAKKQGMKLALVSNSSRDYIERWLARLDLGACFDCVVTRMEVSHPKPAPDLYLLALERLKLASDQVIAIEDSDLGLQAATSAGLRAAAFLNPATRQTKAGDFPLRVDLAQTGPAELINKIFFS